MIEILFKTPSCIIFLVSGCWIPCVRNGPAHGGRLPQGSRQNAKGTLLIMNNYTRCRVDNGILENIIQEILRKIRSQCNCVQTALNMLQRVL